MVEYGLIASLIAVVTILAVGVSGVNLACLYWDLHNVVADNGEQACPYGRGAPEDDINGPVGWVFYKNCETRGGTCVGCCVNGYDACMLDNGGDLAA
jgi:hypothetical protein